MGYVEDPTKQSAFFNGLDSELNSHKGEDLLLVICKHEPPDTEQYTAHRDEPGASVTRQAKLTALVNATYKTHNASSFKVVYERLDLRNRPQMEWWIRKHFTPSFDGHALYQFVLKKADWSSGERQEQLQRSYWAMVCTIPIPTPTELEDLATKLYGSGSKSRGTCWRRPSPSIMKRGMELMPRGNREIEAFCGNTGFHGAVQ